MKRVVSLVLVLVVLFGAPTAWADNPVSFDAYRRAVAQALALVQQANTRAPNERATELNQAIALLEPIRAVQLPSGAETPVDNTALIALLRDASKTEQAVTRLTALQDVLAQPLAEIHPRDLAVLQQILSRPPFADETSTLPPWLQEMLKRIADIFDRLVNNTARGIFDGRDVIIVFGILLGLGVLFYFIRHLRRNLAPEKVLAPLPEEHATRAPSAAFARAEFFIRQGDYRNAVRQLYLATLLLLDQRGKLRYDPTLTNREYLRQALNDPRTTAALAPIVETFDRTWYGLEPLSQSEFDAYRARVEAVREL
jgi:hypothetical protein